MANPLIVDGRNFLDPARCARAGFTYEGIGRPAQRRRRRRRLMQAVVLVGGEGTRLRPLTLTQPKPALPLVDRPFIRYMVDWLGRHGIDEVIMACGFRAEDLRAALGDEVPGGPSIRYVAGGRAARHRRAGAPRRRPGPARRPLHGPQRRRAHRPRPDRASAPARARPGRRSRSALHPVDDPTSYGLVRRERATARCSASSRSPTRREIDTDEISAGAYVIERSVARPDPAPGARSRSSARSSRGSSATGSTAAGSRATGWTSARPSATCRRAGTSSRARSRPSSTGAGGPFVEAGAEVARRRERSGRGRWCAPGSRGRRGRADRRLGAARRLPGRRPAPRCAARSSPPGSRSATGATIAPGAVIGARRADRSRASSWPAAPGSSPDEVVEAEVQRRERRARARSARSTRAASSTTSSRSPSTCATRSGGSSRPASSRPTPAA